MDDYFFLILAVALSIFGAINQNKKKKSGDNSLTEKKERPGNYFMDQLLGQNFFAVPEEEVKPQITIRPVMKKEPMVIVTPISQSGRFHSEFISTLPDRQIKNLQPTLRKQRVEEVAEELETDETPSYLESFTLRKAFVYSEIMTPKY